MSPQACWKVCTPSVVVTLVEAAALGGDLLPQLLAYVDRLAHQVGDEHGLEMHRWIDAVGAGFGLSAQQIRLLCSSTAHQLEYSIDPV